MPRLRCAPLDVVGNHCFVNSVQESGSDFVELDWLLDAIGVESHGFGLRSLFRGSPCRVAVVEDDISFHALPTALLSYCLKTKRLLVCRIRRWK